MKSCRFKKSCPLLAVWIFFSVLAGCDQKPPPPPVVDSEPPAPTGPVRPTTQELISGPRTALRLSNLPLTALVPASWKIEVLASGKIIFLSGPAPMGDIKIQLSDHGSLPASGPSFLLQGAKKEMAANPLLIKLVDLRSMGDMKVFEEQSVSHATVAADNGTSSTNTSTTRPRSEITIYTWTEEFFVQNGDRFDTYALDFVGLTQEEFDADHDFLKSILDSVSYDHGQP